MKKTMMWMLAAILTLCGTTTVLTSCDDDDVENVMETLNIVGRWKTTVEVTPSPVDEMEITFLSDIEFKGDGTVISHFDLEDDLTDAKWTLRDKTLILTQSIEGEVITNTLKIQDGWTRDRMVMTYNFTDVDESGKEVVYTVTVIMNRVK